MKRHRAITFASWLLLLFLVIIVGCQSTSSVSPTPPGGETEMGLGGDAYVSVTGKVLPAHRASLSFGISGLVKDILVDEGQEVTRGQILATLDLPELEAAVAQAEAALDVAQAQLAKLEAGVRPEQVEVLGVGVSLAQEGVAASEVAVDISSANVQVAVAALDTAQASLKRLIAGPTDDELEVARQRIELAKAQLYASQGQRDAVGGQRGKFGYQVGTWEAAEGQVMAGETLVTIEDLSYRILEAGARAEAIAVGEAQVRQAQANLDVARVQERSASQQLAISQAQVRQAQAQMNLGTAPARQEELALVRAQVEQAEASLAAARAASGKAVLTAPFKGVIAEVNLRCGEYVMMSVPVMALGDLGSFRVETTDLDEIDVARVAKGRRVILTFDALPEAEFPAKVERIALKAGAGGGGTTYKAIITFEAQDPRLRWGMTAFADIETE